MIAIIEMIWDDQIEEIETSWQEISTYYKEWLKDITCSEIDHKENSICYTLITSDVCKNYLTEDDNKPGPGLNFFPLIFQSLYYIETRKGSLKFER